MGSGLLHASWGYGVVAALLLALGCLIAARITHPDIIDIGGQAWVTAYGNLPTPVAVARLNVRVDGLSFLMAVVVLAGAIVSVLTIAQSLSASLRGYGRLWTALLVMLSGVLISFASTDLLLFAFGWGLTLAGTAFARRIVGGDDQHPPVVLSMGALSLLGLLAGIQGLVVRADDPTSGSYALSDVSASLTVLPWLAFVGASAIAMGLPPFGRGVSSDEGAPPLIHGTITALGMPVLGIYTLLRLHALSLGRWSESWFLLISVLGGLALFIGAAAALRSTRFGPLIGNQMIAQWGVVLLLLGRFVPSRPLDDPTNSLIVVAVLLLSISTIWSTLLSTLALGVLERRTGSDVLENQPLLEQAFRAAGWAYGVAAATAVGLPPVIGFWGRFWFFDQADTSLIVPLLLSGSVLVAMSYVGPLALFWRRQTTYQTEQATLSGREHDPVLIIATLPLVLWALLPQLLHGLLTLPALQSIRPLGILDQTLLRQAPAHIVSSAVIILVALGAAWRAHRGPVAAPWQGGEDTDLHYGTAHTPHALGHTLSWVALLSNPRELFQKFGRGLERLSSWIGWSTQAFSGRYYLTGILVAALTLMLLLIQ